MHPLIGFLSFIFSPSDDWVLKQAFELVLDPKAVVSTADSYHRMARQYPSVESTAEGKVLSADSLASAVWADILEHYGEADEADQIWTALLKDDGFPSEYAGDVRLRLGENALAQGNVEKARGHFDEILKQEGPRRLEAKINLLTCELLANDREKIKALLTDLTAELGESPACNRAIFPMGLAAFADGDYESATRFFSQIENDPRSHYFNGLALRRQGRPQEALAAWENIRRQHAGTLWARLSTFQLAETYFALGDDRLCRAVCEKALEQNPEGLASEKFLFRLASVDVRAGRYDQAAERLSTVLADGSLRDRSIVLLAESLAKTGRSKELYAVLGKNRPDQDSAGSIYQTAWAALFDGKSERALSYAEEGLENFFDPHFTPRLLLLQGLVHENRGQEAEALAAYQTVTDRFPQTREAAQSVHWMTLAYMRMGRWKEAVTHGAYAWNQLPPENQKAHAETAFWLGEAHLKLKRYEDADRHYQSFLSLASHNHELLPNALFQRSVTLAHLDRNEAAVASLDEFLKRAPEPNKDHWPALAQLQKGHIYFNKRQFDKAVLAYRAATGSSKALYYEGLALYRMDYFADAAQVWARAAKDHSSTLYGEWSAFRTARTQFELGKATEAVGAFAYFIKTYPNSPRVQEALLQSAHALYNAGDFQSAAPLYAQYLSRYPTPQDKAAVTPYLAGCYAQQGKSAAEAQALLAGLPPTETLASMQMDDGARSYNQQRFADAGGMFAELLARMPAHDQSASALFYHGESLFARREWREAEGAFHNYLSLYPAETQAHGPIALFHQAVSAYQQDKLLKAAQLFDAFLQRFPSDNLASDAKENLTLCYYNLGDWGRAEKVNERYPNVTPADGELKNAPQWVSTLPAAETENRPPDPVVDLSSKKPIQSSRRAVVERPSEGPRRYYPPDLSVARQPADSPQENQ